MYKILIIVLLFVSFLFSQNTFYKMDDGFTFNTNPIYQNSYEWYGDKFGYVQSQEQITLKAGIKYELSFNIEELNTGYLQFMDGKYLLFESVKYMIKGTYIIKLEFDKDKTGFLRLYGGDNCVSKVSDIKIIIKG